MTSTLGLGLASTRAGTGAEMEGALGPSPGLLGGAGRLGGAGF